MKLLVLLLNISGVLCKVRYDNYTLFQIIPKVQDEVTLLKEFGSRDGFNFWSDVAGVGNPVEVLVAPEAKQHFQESFQRYRSQVNILSDNIQTWIDNEKIGSYDRSIGMTFDSYHTLDDIYKWLDDLIAAFPGIITKQIAGTTYEGRLIEGIKISHGSGRRAIFLEGGIHCREWISMATVSYLTNEILFSEDEEMREAARSYDWYIFPVTNPDGYVYTHEVNRLWRKNTRPVSNRYGTGLGVDLNRNWNSHWMVEGTSDVPTSSTYGGNGPFSEIETRTLSTYIRSVADQVEMYLSFHSFSQLLLLPYGHTTEPLDNYHDVVTIGRRAMGSLAVRHGTQFITGNVAEAIYHASGGSIDWVKSALKVPIVLCYELRDTGRYGFLLPAEEIKPSGEETTDSLLALIREGKRLGYFQ